MKVIEVVGWRRREKEMNKEIRAKLTELGLSINLTEKELIKMLPRELVDVSSETEPHTICRLEIFKLGKKWVTRYKSIQHKDILCSVSLNTWVNSCLTMLIQLIEDDILDPKG